MCGDCFVCIYLVCQCDGLELGRRNRRITVRGVAVRINTPPQDVMWAQSEGTLDKQLCIQSICAFCGGGRVCDAW